jgi:hypothetical protein
VKLLLSLGLHVAASIEAHASSMGYSGPLLLLLMLLLGTQWAMLLYVGQVWGDLQGLISYWCRVLSSVLSLPGVKTAWWRWIGQHRDESRVRMWLLLSIDVSC